MIRLICGIVFIIYNRLFTTTLMNRNKLTNCYCVLKASSLSNLRNEDHTMWSDYIKLLISKQYVLEPLLCYKLLLLFFSDLLSNKIFHLTFLIKCATYCVPEPSIERSILKHIVIAYITKCVCVYTKCT